MLETMSPAKEGEKGRGGGPPFFALLGSLLILLFNFEDMRREEASDASTALNPTVWRLPTYKTGI